MAAQTVGCQGGGLDVTRSFIRNQGTEKRMLPASPGRICQYH